MTSRPVTSRMGRPRPARHEMPEQRPHLILPCETRHREFEAKLLLAAHAAERGWDVTVGAKKAIDQRLARLPRGVYVGKSVTARVRGLFGILRLLGHTVTTWDEEGLVFASPEVYHATKVGPGVLDLPVRLFAWGEANAEAWRSHPDYGGTPIAVTGNPRADLLRPELRGYFAPEAEALRARHGDFILINTNFSRLNHFNPGESRQRHLVEDGGAKIVTEDDPRLGLARHKEALFAAFQEMAPALARRFPDRRLVLRPHPSESPALWRGLLADCPNAEVVYEGNAAAWLMAAGVMVHNGCTTAVESFLLDRPAIAYRPVTSDLYDHPLPNSLSLEARDLDGLFARVGEALEGGAEARREALAERHAIAQRAIASIEGARACERILDALDDLAQAPARRAPAARLGGTLLAEGNAMLKRIEARRAGHRNSAAYLAHMFPPAAQSEVHAYLARFAGLLGRFRDLRLADTGESVFRLSAG